MTLGSMAEAAETITTRMELAEWLDDLTVRFLLNLPHDELSSMSRLCFQAEEAQWYYEDFIRPLNPKLPSLNLKQFCLTLFQHCPLFNTFSEAQHLAAYEEFLAYKVRVPVRGAILLDDDMERVLLVRGWKKGSSWSFPRGKINKDEKDIDCAIREVWEETGFDVRAAGLEKANSKAGHVKAIDIMMKEQHLKMFVFRGVALDTHFEPKTRKEISDIQWYDIKDLPGNKKQKATNRNGQATKYYMVAPFLGPLKKWIHQQRMSDATYLPAAPESYSLPAIGNATTLAEEEAYIQAEESAALRGTPAITPSDELKRLLSIGIHSPSATPTQQPQLTQSARIQSPDHKDHTNSLLHLLRGSQTHHTPSIPQMAPEQVYQTVSQPLGPSLLGHSQHPYSDQQSQHMLSPDFSRPPHNIHQAQQQHPHHFSASAAPIWSAFSQESGHSMQMPQRWNGHLSQHSIEQPIRQLHQPAQVPMLPSPESAHPERDAGVFADSHAQITTDRGHQYNQSQEPTLDSHRQSLLNSIMSPESQTKPLMAGARSQAAPNVSDSGPKVPDASQLPAPQLNAHTKKLLDAFNAPNQKPVGSDIRNTTGQGLKSGSQHQTALLGLLGKAPISTATAVSAVPQEIPNASTTPTISDANVTNVAPKAGERRSTLNEITRTLHSNFKSKGLVTHTPEAQMTPSQHDSAVEKSKVQAPLQSSHATTKVAHATIIAPTERPKSQGQLFDPKNPKKLVNAATHDNKDDKSSLHALTSATPRSPSHHKQSSKASKSPRIDQEHVQHGSAAPQYSILQRSGPSVPGKMPKTPAVSSPPVAKAASSAFQPQVLKRPVPDNTGRTSAPAKQAPHTEPSPTPSKNSKDKLLALFSQPLKPASAPVERFEPVEQQQNGSPTNVPTTSATETIPPAPALKTPEPPPAPLLLPERIVTSRSSIVANGAAPSQQQQLLDLFNRRSPMTVTSPGTPISPFTLDTPIARRPPPLRQLEHPQPRSRLGSTTSTVDIATPTASGRHTPSSAVASVTTPTETKGVLLGILNGVLAKEGHRGAGKAR